MNNTNLAQWVLRIAVAGEFLGHGAFAVGLWVPQKMQWAGWIQTLTDVDAATATQLLTLVGISDFLVALIILLYPVRIVLLWAAFWGFWTALVRPLVGEPFWDFVERWANWGAPLALLLLRGWPRGLPTRQAGRDWLR
ncbi:MAG: hypothetical protein A3A44_03610 [Candidatus Sungbacteria bacterium RIFCSPLOWO2_01_FULL_60_25]|uniref:DoxX family protein n=1 Tax=Candidatus Sungbacteria bacterium RIFCSPLOWO2_01_FULL_60_25 TaxID=1802281 RepID=A0A1G2LD15_9BACT|nr:MAG: hypothetical protein A3A44_03610 [Candidatus Sungbacteria bacterium RIFCSPLOWO2_01_FULL_60_25]